MSKNYLILAVMAMVAIYSSAMFFSASARDYWEGERNVETIYGKVVDDDGNPLPARVELWYANLTPIAEEMGENISESEQWMRNLFHAAHTTEKGWYRLEAPAGQWLVRVSRGPEYEIKEAMVTVNKTAENKTDTASVRMDWTLNHLYDLESLGWYSGDMHVHSSHSDGRQPVSEIAGAMLANDVDFAPLTDHNSVSGLEEWLLYESDEFLPVGGVEITTKSALGMEEMGIGFGHQNAIGITELVGATKPENMSLWYRYVFSNWTDVQAAIDETHARGGLYMLNHPFWIDGWPDGTISTWGKIHDYDAIEIYNGWPDTVGAGPHMDPTYGGVNVNTNTLATQAWFELMNAGNRVSGWGSTDSHDVLGLKHTDNAPDYWRSSAGNARTYVHSHNLSWDDVKDALKAGNAFVTAGYWGPLLLVDSQGSEPGDEVEAENGTLPLHIRLLSNRPLGNFSDGIRIIVGGQVVKTLPTIEGAMEMEENLTIEVKAENDTWAVVEAFGQWPSMAITNAIYLDLPPFGEWGASEWTYPEGSDRWMSTNSSLPEVTVPDGPARSQVTVGSRVELIEQGS